MVGVGTFTNSVSFFLFFILWWKTHSMVAVFGIFMMTVLFVYGDPWVLKFMRFKK